MKVLILAAGYGTRLERDIKADTSGKYSHLVGVPKPLVPVGGIALLGHWLKALHEIESIDVSDDVFLVTNASNHRLFIDYLSKLAEDTNNDIVVPPSHIIDDGTLSNDTRKGAIADIELFVRFSGIEHTEDLMIIGGDTLFYPNDFNLATLLKKFNDQSAVSDALVLYHTVADTRKTGILEIDEKTHLAKQFLEKPEPTATTARNSCPCFYLFRGTPYYQHLTYYMTNVAKELKDVDAPGTFLAWLINNNKMRILPHKIEGRFDIGGLNSYIEANEYFIKKFAEDKNRAAAAAAALPSAPPAEENNVIRRASSAVVNTVTTTSHWLLTLPTLGPLLTALINHRCEGVCPHTSCLLAMIRGFRQGIVYGAKVRFPHAFVMTFLFRQGTFTEKINDIFLATYQHSKNLGCYVFLYKTIQCIVRHLRKEESGINTLISGFLAGGFMFGDNNPVNTQINMYIFSRIIFGAARTLVRHNILPENSHTWGYPLFAATAWALVMYLFEWQNDTLQKSLVSSMIYLYQDSNKWPTDAAGITDWLVRGH